MTNNNLNKSERDLQTSLFEGLKAAIIEHAGGDFLRLKDGESVVATVDVINDADPTKCTPRFEEIDDFKKPGKVSKMRLDLWVGNTKKIFHIGAQSQREVVALLERGVRRKKISRLGNGKTTTYIFTAVQQEHP